MKNCVFVNVGTDIPLALAMILGMVKEDKELKLPSRLISFKIGDESSRIVNELGGISNQDTIFCFSLYIWNFKKTYELCRLLKEQIPDSKMILGGPHATPIAELILRKHPAVDFIVCGEGELTFPELLKNLDNPGSVKGVAYRKQGEPVRTGPRELIENLDIIPSPFIEGIIPVRPKDQPMITYRGCVFNCGYCYYPTSFKKKIRSFSYERIEQDLRYCLQFTSKIYYMDPIFNIDKDRLKKLAEIIKGLNRKDVELFVEIKAELVDEESIQYLKDCQVTRVELGLQTTNPETLKNCNRYFDAEKFKRGCFLLREAGIKYAIGAIIGLPGDNFKAVKKTLDFTISLTPSLFGLPVLSVIPGTDIYNNMEKFGIKINDKYEVVESNSWTQEEIKLAKEYANKMSRQHTPKTGDLVWFEKKI